MFGATPLAWALYYIFEDHLYPKPVVKYIGSSETTSRYDAIFRERVSSFDSRSEMQHAEQLVNKLVNTLTESE